jgi:pimeloyl-ACP methyl ester carboxylesterase
MTVETLQTLQTNIIQRHTNSSETHQVQTEDGYILNLFRIRRENPRGVIFFQHGVTGDARCWVSQYNDSVAFLFWRAGYDVWLGNTRGNLYAKKHVTWKPSDGEFWNFRFGSSNYSLAYTKSSLLEIGYYDHDASVEYIKNTTSEGKIIYVGFSMGATTGLIYASMRPAKAFESLQIMISIAPCTHFMYAADSVLKYIVPVSEIMQVYTRIYRVFIYPQSWS